MNRLLIGWTAPSNVHADFKRAQMVQKMFRQAVGDRTVVVVGDRHLEGQWLNLRFDDLTDKGVFNLSRMRNRVFDFALRCPFVTHVLLLDADCVLLQAPSIFPPRDGWAHLMCYHDRPDGLTFTEPDLGVLLWRYQKRIPYGRRPKNYNFRVAGTLLIGIDLIRRGLRYDEDFVGSTCQDNHMTALLRRRYCQPSYTDAVLLHMWHPPRTSHNIQSNEKLLREKLRKI